MINTISERYYRPTRIFVTGMGAAIILPWLILLGFNNVNSGTPQLPVSGSIDRFATLLTAPMLLQFALLWLFLLFIRKLFDWANDWLHDEEADHNLWRTALVIAFVLMLPVLNRILFYPYAAAPLFAPTRGLLNALFNFTEGWRPENTLIFFYIICWMFATWVSSQVMGTYEIGRLFGFGLLLVALATGWLAGLGTPQFVSLIFLFMACGLASLALTHIDHKISRGYHSPGASLSPAATAQFVGMGFAIMLVASWLAAVISPERLRFVLSLFQPLWNFLGLLAGWIWIILEPVLEFIFNLIAAAIESIMSQIQFSTEGGDIFGAGETTEIPTFREMLESSDQIRYVLIGFIIIVGLALFWLIVNRTILKRYRSEQQVELNEVIADDSGLFANLGNQLRGWLNNLRGMRPKLLLDPETVENMYANVSRLASRKGFSRRVSQTPDQYLPVLFEAFPENEGALRLLTARYMQVYYGEEQLSPADLQALKTAYKTITQSAAEAEQEEAQ